MEDQLPGAETAARSLSDEPAPAWQPLSAMARRVLGVLVEKAKTTPEAYPLTLNALKNACNQKSNRHPLMQLDETDVVDALDHLRGLGAVTEVHGSGRVAKFRHLAYEWLGVDKVELAVMTELLLRGTQTIGELRGRASRMETIADMSALKPILQRLNDKGLVEFLTPEGRGRVVTHALYQPAEMDKQRQQLGGSAASAPARSSAPTTQPSTQQTAPPRPPAPPATEANAAQEEIDTLRRQVQRLREETDELRAELLRATEDLRRDLDDVRAQLGIG